jgi:signal transduction histidine kinase
LISLGRLSAGVAHEIRNPLNAMKGAIVYLQRRKSHDTLIQEYTQLILEEIDRLNQFVTEFLYFARQSSPNLTPANLNELIRNTLNLFEEKFREKGINVVKHLDPSLPSLMIDPNQMEQVIVNLFINACDAMAEGGVLELSTEIKRDGQGADSSFRALVKVEDDGAGIPHEHLQNIFDPFFSTKETGTGLGLPISLGIVESHGGKLKVQSQESKGTKVIIELPVMENDMEQQVKSAKEENTGR